MVKQDCSHKTTKRNMLKPMRVINKALKITSLDVLDASRSKHFNKGDKKLIDSCGVFFLVPRQYEASFYKVTFCRRPVREERPVT